MAVETPYRLMSPTGQTIHPGHAAHAQAGGSNDHGMWVEPGLQTPPTSQHGELVLTSGSRSTTAWEWAWAQVIGQRHHYSEDSLGVKWLRTAPSNSGQQADESVVLVLADGVGGGARGDVTSHALVRYCLNDIAIEPGSAVQPQLVSQLAGADSAVNRALAAITTRPGAATLAAVWLAPDSQGWVCRVGDARVSLLHTASGAVTPLLADQSYANLGETPPHTDDLHAPARMVGAGLMGEPEVASMSVRPDEILMLSSDGLHEWLKAGDSARLNWDSATLEDAAKTLVLLARDRGSDDDISVLLARKR